jgi:hypothetical protein
MDPELQAKADADAAALQRDVQMLEDEAARAGKKLASRLGPPVGALLVLVLVAWLLGRRSRRARDS